MNVDMWFLSTVADKLYLSTIDDMKTNSPFVDKVVPMKVNSMRDVAAAVRGRRKDLGLSQAGLATGVGVSRAWINTVEAGKPSVEFDLVLRLLDHLDLRLDLAKPGNLGDVVKARSVDLDSVLDEYRDR
jgi:HTH-type transcriptional regulator / antitoxin HipB